MVTSNGILGDCDITKWNATSPACAFAYSAPLTPTVISIVSSTTVTFGSLLTVTGTGFYDASAGVGQGSGGTDVNITFLNAVWLNRKTACRIVDGNATSLTCVVPAAQAGNYTVDVEVVGAGSVTPRGLATQPPLGPLMVSYPLVVDSISPSEGSAVGGTRVVVRGVGFAPDGSDVVLVSGSPCAVSAVSFTQITCTMPNPGAAWDVNASAYGSLTVPIAIDGTPYSTFFTYNASLTPQVVGISPRTLSSGRTGVVNLTVTGIPVGDPVAVTFGNRICTGLTTTFTLNGSALVSCVLVRNTAPPLPQLPVPPLVYVDNLGNANVTGVALDVSLVVLNTSVSSGSLLGGTVVNFTGAG